MKRWACPKCGAGVLAPARPARDDVRRFCLKCSRQTGRLVARVCPAAAKAATRAVEARRTDALRERTRARSRLAALWSVAGVDLRQTAARFWAVLHHATRVPPMPTLIVRRSASRHGVDNAPGHAWHRSQRITMTFGHEVDRATVLSLLLHELSHLAVGRGHAHGETYNRRMSEAAIRLWDVGLPICRGYGPSRFLTQALRARFAAETTTQQKEATP